MSPCIEEVLSCYRNLALALNPLHPDGWFALGSAAVKVSLKFFMAIFFFLMMAIISCSFCTPALGTDSLSLNCTYLAKYLAFRLHMHFIFGFEVFS